MLNTVNLKLPLMTPNVKSANQPDSSPARAGQAGFQEGTRPLPPNPGGAQRSQEVSAPAVWVQIPNATANRIKTQSCLTWAHLEMTKLREDRERQISYAITDTWTLKKRYRRIYLENRKRLTDLKNKLMVTQGTTWGEQ